MAPFSIGKSVSKFNYIVITFIFIFIYYKYHITSKNKEIIYSNKNKIIQVYKI